VCPKSALDVVVVAYESAGTLAACLSALPASARVVVVDNASGDESAGVAEALGAGVVRNSENRGFAAAANQGAALGGADLVLFLNPDAVVAEPDLQRLVDAVAGHPSTAAVSPRLVRADGGEQRAWWPFPSPAETWREAFGLHRFRSAGPGEDGAVPFVTGACLLVRRAAGGFDERFWLYGEDADLCRRLWSAGWRVRVVPEAVAVHVGGGSASADFGRAFEHFYRGAEHFVAKHHGARGLALHRAGLVVGSVLRVPFLAARRSGEARRRLAAAGRAARLLVSHPGRVS
jgi:hypothetical protein